MKRTEPTETLSLRLPRSLMTKVGLYASMQGRSKNSALLQIIEDTIGEQSELIQAPGLTTLLLDRISVLERRVLSLEETR